MSTKSKGGFVLDEKRNMPTFKKRSTKQTKSTENKSSRKKK